MVFFFVQPILVGIASFCSFDFVLYIYITDVYTQLLFSPSILVISRYFNVKSGAADFRQLAGCRRRRCQAARENENFCKTQQQPTLFIPYDLVYFLFFSLFNSHLPTSRRIDAAPRAYFFHFIFSKFFPFSKNISTLFFFYS